MVNSRIAAVVHVCIYSGVLDFNHVPNEAEDQPCQVVTLRSMNSLKTTYLQYYTCGLSMPPAGSISSSTGLVITNPLVAYRALLATKRIDPDPAQVSLIGKKKNAISVFIHKAVWCYGILIEEIL
jgi:hypothetical protein